MSALVAPAGILFCRAGGSAAYASADHARRAGAAWRRDFDGRFSHGLTRRMPSICWAPRAGVYLEGYGAVFSTELNLILSPNLSPFQPSFTKLEISRIHDRKMQRLPLLKQNMREMLMASAVVAREPAA